MKKLVSILLTLAVAISLMIVPAMVSATGGDTSLLEGSYSYVQDGWLFVHLEGSPYQIGYQNGYLTADDSANACLSNWVGDDKKDSWTKSVRKEAEMIIWPMIPQEYKDEIEGIVDGLHAAGYDNWDKWDVVAANDWADQDIYKKTGGCSAFAAAGNATTDGQIVIGHVTMSPKDEDYMCHVMFDVTPADGYRFRYQSAGGMIWSGHDWFVNETGLMVGSTSIPNKVRNPEGTPAFVREREAVQYTDNIDDFITAMTTNNNGANPSEWLIGDAKTGEICSLSLGCYAWDINRTFNGFYPSCNYLWYENSRIEAGYPVPAPDPPTSVRAVRWLELIDEYYGEIDVEVGKLFFEDDIISSYNPTRTSGGYDGKVTSSELVLDNMGMWARWGSATGKPFDLEAYLAGKTSKWIDSHEWYIANLSCYVERTPQPWTYITGTWPIGVEIDIKPGSNPNSINPDSKGAIPVAILTTDVFDASTVDPDTVLFGPAGARAVQWAFEDVDSDGDEDMLLYFDTEDTGIRAGDTEAGLIGKTLDGTEIYGSDSIRVID